MEALVTAAFSEDYLEKLGSLVQIRTGGWAIQKRRLTPEEMIQEIGDAEVLITELDPVTAEVLENCPALKLIGSCRGNPVNVDTKAASERGIPVLFTPARNAVSVAEMTVALMINLARNIIPANQSLLKGHWGEEGLIPYLFFRGIELQTRTVGLVGFGAVAREVASRLKPFGMKLVVYDPYIAPSVLAEFEARSVSLEELFAESDFISVHCKVTPETTGLIGKALFSLMKPTAYFINTARAVVTDEQALYETLLARKIGGAALDVFGIEPVDPTNQFLQLDNVLVTPHIGGATHDVVRHHSEIMTEDVIAFLAGKEPRYVYNKEALKKAI